MGLMESNGGVHTGGVAMAMATATASLVNGLWTHFVTATATATYLITLQRQWQKGRNVVAVAADTPPM